MLVDMSHCCRLHLISGIPVEVPALELWLKSNATPAKCKARHYLTNRAIFSSITSKNWKQLVLIIKLKLRWFHHLWHSKVLKWISTEWQSMWCKSTNVLSICYGQCPFSKSLMSTFTAPSAFIAVFFHGILAIPSHNRIARIWSISMGGEIHIYTSVDERQR